jgi:glyoxylase-like metal-dependent hydrolase (beta-lactamase superfamily II)
VSDVAVELVPLLGGEIRLTARFEHAPPGPLPSERTLLAQLLGVRQHWAPVPAFLLRHPTEGDVLVDTAYDPTAAIDPVRTLGPATGRLFKHRPRPLRPQLAALGAEPGIVVMTHLHSDHVSGLGQFPAATVVCDRLEWEAAHARGSWLNGYVPGVLEGVRDRRLVDLDAGEPRGPFAHTHDLFGDGSVRLLATRGHSVGHCSILVRTGSGEVLLCGDACGDERGLYELEPMALFVDREAALASMRAIQQWLRGAPGRLAVPGHDPGWTAWLASGARL